MEDRRFLRCEDSIKRAFLALLAEKQPSCMTMTELARKSQVSRSTLYAHYANIPEVYQQLVRDFYARLSPLRLHLRCEGCHEQANRSLPFCVALRQAGDYLPLVRDAQFFPAMFAQLEQGMMEGDSLKTYLDLGLDKVQAQAALRFQMSGCYAVALSSVADRDWPRVQRTLDAFIRGGLGALKVPTA